MFGKRTVAAMVKKLKQLNKVAVEGKQPNNMSAVDKQKVFLAVNLVEEKRYGIVKGCSCANGSNQHQQLKEGETVALSTVSTKANLASLIVDAYEQRDVATYDVSGAFLQSDTPKDQRMFMIFLMNLLL